MLPYPQERVLEDVLDGQEAVPTRIFPILLPIWQVEVEATVTEGQPYELIDRYLELGISEAGLDTPADLAAFLALDPALVDRALRFLRAIGHVVESGGRLALTPLGQWSIRDRRRYIVSRQDRRKMYFDAFGSRPLTRGYYDARVVTMLSAADLAAVAGSWDRGRFLMLHTTHGFRREALTELAHSRERDHYNLPARIDEPRSLGEEEVYLPMYLVRALGPGQHVRYLAYTQTGAVADPDLSSLCEQTPEIVVLAETEDRFASAGADHPEVGEWLRRKNLEAAPPTRLDSGLWRVTLPAAAFGASGQLSLAKLGSFVVIGTDIVQLWSQNEQARHQALLRRVDSYLDSQSRANAADADRMIAKIARQLELPPIDARALRTMAAADKRHALAAQLGRLG